MVAMHVLLTPFRRTYRGLVWLAIPLITAHFASKLIVDQDAFRHEEQEELKNNLRRVRALLEAFAEREGVTLPDSASPPAAPGDR
jgi:voltage-gated potassium channel